MFGSGYFVDGDLQCILKGNILNKFDTFFDNIKF